MQQEKHWSDFFKDMNQNTIAGLMPIITSIIKEARRKENERILKIIEGFSVTLIDSKQFL